MNERRQRGRRGLRPIRLDRREGCEHPDIVEGERFYLVKIYGMWYGGPFSRQWYGLSFDRWGHSGIQLDSPGIERIYEVRGLRDGEESAS